MINIFFLLCRVDKLTTNTKFAVGSLLFGRLTCVFGKKGK